MEVGKNKNNVTSEVFIKESLTSYPVALHFLGNFGKKNHQGNV